MREDTPEQQVEITKRGTWVHRSDNIHDDLLPARRKQRFVSAHPIAHGEVSDIAWPAD